MQTYPTSCSFVNPAAPFGLPKLPVAVSSGAASFYRWVSNWHTQTGDVWASTSYLMRKAARSETTIYRWLRELRQKGYLECDTVPGVERRIIPLLPAELLQIARDAKRGQPRLNARQLTLKPPRKISYKSITKNKANDKKMAGVMAGVMTGVPPDTRRFDKKTTTQNGVEKHGGKNANPTHNETKEDCLKGAAIAALIKTGLDASAAGQLVADAGAETVLEQVKALAYRRASNPLGVLVVSIKKRWSIPDTVANARKAQKQAEKMQADRLAKERALVAVRAKEGARIALLEQRLAGMSAFERAELEKQAAGLWQKEQPGGFAVMSGKPVGAVVLRDFMARVLESLAAKDTA